MRPGRDVLGQLLELTAQLIDTFASRRAHSTDVRVGQDRSTDEFPNLFLGDIDQSRIHEIDLGHRHETSTHTENVDDVGMLGGLGHDPVVCGNHEQRQVDARAARHHVAHKSLMARHIDDAQPSTIRHLQTGKAQVNRQASFLLFLQAIGIDAR